MANGKPRVWLDHRKDGTPFVVVDFGRPHGKRKQRQRGFRGLTDEQALAAGREWADELVEAMVGGDFPTLAEQAERIIRRHVMLGHSDNSVRKERTIVGNYLGRLAGIHVSDITPADVSAQLGELLEHGGKTGRVLSRNTVSTVRAHFHRWFVEMVADEAVPVTTNPVDTTTRVKAEPIRGEALAEGDVAKLCAWIEPSLRSDSHADSDVRRRNAAFAMLIALYTGMRIGEVCALRRRDVVFINDTIVVNSSGIGLRDGQPYRRKQTKGHRDRAIKMGPTLRRGMHAHLAWQAAGEATLGTDSPLLNVDGSWMPSSYIADEFARMRRECDIDGRFTFHSLRHTHATWLLAQGVDLRTVSERLGHADPATTARIYAHAIPGAGERAAALGEQTVSMFAAEGGVALDGLWMEEQDGTSPLLPPSAQLTGANESLPQAAAVISTNYRG